MTLNFCKLMLFPHVSWSDIFWRRSEHSSGSIPSDYQSIYAAKSLQSCPTLCNPIDSSPPGSCPWDSPGKNTGVGCHFLLQCMKVKVKLLSRVWLLATPWTAAYRLLRPWDFPGKSTGVGCHCLLRKHLYNATKKACWPLCRLLTLASPPWFGRSKMAKMVK